MFSVNGPSGPQSRHERRVKTETDIKAEKARSDAENSKKREQFFTMRKTTDKPASASGKQSTKAKQTGTTSEIFKGCQILFNGRTGKVSSYYLAKLVEDHGGRVCSAYSGMRVTHMVGYNLSGSKADKVLKNCNGKVKFVSPDWVLQSVQRKKRQPEFQYLVYTNNSSASLLTSAAVKGPAGADDASETHAGAGSHR